MKRKAGLDLASGQQTTNPTLRELLARAEVHGEAEQRVLAALPASLAKSSRFVSVKDGDMVISAESSVVASQLRFRQHDIMARLRQDSMFQYVWRLKVKVAPRRHANRPKAEKAPLSHKNARLLKEAAGHTKDKHLREVLEKLASHVRN